MRPVHERSSLMVLRIILEGVCMVFGVTIVGFILSKIFSREKDD